MAYRSFRHFLESLEHAGELTRVADRVDTDLLIAEWADREMKSSGGGKALLFEQPVVDGQVSKFPVAINTMGSRKRIAMALGRESIDAIAQPMREMSAFIGCKFSMNERRRCIGRSTRSARGTANVITSATNGCRSQLRSAAIPRFRLLPPRRCRMGWMKFCSRDFCDAN